MTDQLSNGFFSQEFKLKIPDGDDRIRRVCSHCQFVDYINPKIIAASVVTKGSKILLCRRAIDPRKGFWTLPAGFMEQGETVEEAARREAREEANAEIRIDRVLAVYSVPRISQVQIMFRAELVSDISPGPESLEVELFDWRDIPWSNLAFPTVLWGLTHYAETRSKTVFAPFSNPPGTEALTR
ncbi:MAG TPA: NUDIX hydrolase [Hyphomonas atlantica]|mgnify:CR=1 FL=1|uniref:NUDIX hydrolase n=1 Tax=Hyphomonas atlantica TaxID=1280948 RepID=A0A356W7S7_9PROT|nr:NUDIX hydrolase [Hyphomonas atlantica]HBQ49720.1 NUDIX hydrolase [Hyphomonas atlantica]|tara:strand:+ start:165 stop:716 length:552 start_codon:yes stop_codon:yes gene_type:complete